MNQNFSQILSVFSQKVRQQAKLDQSELNLLSISLEEITSYFLLSDFDKENLKILFNYFILDGNTSTICITIFSKRFGKKLNNWTNAIPVKFLDLLWRGIENIPPSHYEKNNFINSIEIKSFGKSNIQGDYTRNGVITLAYEMFFETPEYVVPQFLHEVGHAVRRKISNKIIYDWYKSYGWDSFGDSNEEINKWIDLMGGWENLNHHQQTEIIKCIRQCFGVSKRTYKRGPPPKNIYPGHPWEFFKVKEVYEKTQDYWWNSLDQSYEYNGIVFFFNFFYMQLMTVSHSTIQLIYDSAINKYALMGREEFFAELYSYYYDPMNKGKLVLDIQNWFHMFVDAI